MMTTGVSLYKRTANLSESEPRMTADWDGFKDGQQFEVPLHDNDQPSNVVKTGLVQVQPDILPKEFVEFWMAHYSNPDRPPVLYPDSKWLSINGCPMSAGANRTYYLADAGDYFLHTAAGNLNLACGNFNVKMSCSGGAETASPTENDPMGFSVDPNTGTITGTPKKVRAGSPYRMRLRAVDAASKPKVTTRSPLFFWRTICSLRLCCMRHPSTDRGWV